MPVRRGGDEVRGVAQGKGGGMEMQVTFRPGLLDWSLPPGAKGAAKKAGQDLARKLVLRQRHVAPPPSPVPPRLTGLRFLHRRAGPPCERFEWPSDRKSQRSGVVADDGGDGMVRRERLSSGERSRHRVDEGGAARDEAT